MYSFTIVGISLCVFGLWLMLPNFADYKIIKQHIFTYICVLRMTNKSHTKK